MPSPFEKRNTLQQECDDYNLLIDCENYTEDQAVIFLQIHMILSVALFVLFLLCIVMHLLITFNGMFPVYSEVYSIQQCDEVCQ